MGRTDVDASTSRGVLPAFSRFFTRKYERVRAVFIDDGQFEAAAIWGACDRIPHRAIVNEGLVIRFDLNHFSRPPSAVRDDLGLAHPSGRTVSVCPSMAAHEEARIAGTQEPRVRDLRHRADGWRKVQIIDDDETRGRRRPAPARWRS